MARKSISAKVFKQLFSLSGNKCCFPGCDHHVFNPNGDVLIGEICHIRAIGKGGARYAEKFPKEKLDSFDNLMILCPNHHKEVDRNPDKFKVSVLLRMKAEHERKYCKPGDYKINFSEKGFGEISGDILVSEESLDEEWNILMRSALPEKKRYPRPENYILRYISEVRREGNVNPKSGTLQELIREENRLTILGVGGSGKSVEIDYLAYVHSKEESYLYPVKIRLNTLTDQRIEEILRIEYPDFDLIPQDRLLILLDALDEVHADFQDIVSTKIELMAKRFVQSKIVVSCRNNFYTVETNERKGKLEGFKIFLIQPLDYSSIWFFAKQLLDNSLEDFFEILRRRKLYDLLYSPFFLVHLVNLFRITNEVPESRKLIFEELINRRIEEDLGKFVNSGINIQDQAYKLKIKLQELAIVAECMGRNYLHDQNEVQQLVPDLNLLNVVKRSFLFNKSTDGKTWEFEHNNFQEFLAAQFLQKLSFEAIMKFISIDTNIQGINPSWMNTVSFLFSLLDQKEEKFNLLVSWISEIEPDILIRFEKDKLDLDLRERIFFTVYKSYESKGIIIRNENFESHELARFVSESKVVPEFLIERANLSTERLIVTEALRILGNFELINDYSGIIRDAIIAKIVSDEIPDEIKYECLNTLAELKINDEELTGIILKKIDLESSQYLRTGLYKYLESFDQIGDYLQIIIQGVEWFEGVKAKKNRSRNDEEPYLFSEKLVLERLFWKVESLKNLVSVLEWAIKYEPLTSLNSVFFEAMKTVLKKAGDFYPKNHTLFNLGLELLKSMSRRYHGELGESFRQYYTKTGTISKAFENLYELWLIEKDNGFEFAYAMALICDEECLEFLENEIYSGRFVEPKTWQFRNVLGYDGRQNLNDLYQQKLLKIDPEKYGIQRVDYEELNRNRQSEDLRLLFFPKVFLKEVARVFKEEAKDGEEGRLSEDNLDDYERPNFSYEKMTNTIVSATLRSLANEKGFVELRDFRKLVEDNVRWRWFQIHSLIDFDQRDEDFQFTPEAIEFVVDWVLVEIQSADFTTALEYRGQNTYQYRFSELFISYFIRRLDINVLDETYLDLLFLECYLLPGKRRKQRTFDEEESPDTFDFVVEKLGLERVSRRALENLKGDSLVPAVRQSHFRFCHRYRIEEAAPFILEEIFNSDQSGFDQRALITRYIGLNPEIEPLLKRFSLLSDESKIHLAGQLAESGKLKDLDRMKKIWKHEENEEVKFHLIKIISLIDEHDGFASLKEWILKNKAFPERHQRPVSLSPASVDDLMEIIAHSLKYNYGGSIWSDRNDYLDDLIEKGSKDHLNYNKVCNGISNWLTKYSDTKFLHYRLEDLKRKFQSNLSRVHTFENAVRLVRISQASTFEQNF
jgi:hypothetical protein